MLIRIARHEWHVIIRERRLWWLAAGLLALTALSGAGGITRQRAVVADRADAVTLDRTAWLSQPARNAHAASHYGGFAIKDVSPLALLDPGVEPYTGSVVRIEAHRQGEALFSPAREAGGILRFGLLTPRARTRPDFTSGMAVLKLSNLTWMWPPTRSASAWASPL